MPCSTDRWSLAVLTLSVFASALAETRPEAASGGRLTIHLTAPPAPGDCAPAAAGAWLKAVALGDVLAADADIERYRSDDHALEFTTAATTRLFTNAATYDREEVGVVPAGAFFSAAGRGFVVTLDGKRLVGGMVTTLDRMREPTPCVQLYFLPPLTSGGRLQVSIGRARSEEELGDEPWKVMIEDGIDRVFEARVPKALADYLATTRKSAPKR